MPKQVQLTRKHKLALTALAEGGAIEHGRILDDLVRAGYVSGRQLTAEGRTLAATLIARRPKEPKDE